VILNRGVYLAIGCVIRDRVTIGAGASSAPARVVKEGVDGL
jgi:hypothetical protein